jgi:TolB-like protein/Tfp pilus assembly protein PilF
MLVQATMTVVSLRERMDRSGFTPGHVADIGIQVASALGALHAAGTTHGQLSLDTVGIHPDGSVDIGPALPEGASSDPSTFSSPEQVRGAAVDARSDIWSLGVLLYTLVTRRPTFEGATPDLLANAIVGTEPGALTRFAPDAPAELERIVTKALRKDPGQRYPSVKGLELDLRALKDQLGPETEPLYVGAARPRSGRRSWLAAAGILAAMAMGYLAYVAVMSRRAPSGITSLAVLPFKNLSNDPGKDYLSDGITESLINRLSQLRGVKVIANSSSSRYRGKDANPQEVARALDTAGILAGRISERGGALAISVELIDGRDSTLVWGEQYTRQAPDLMQVPAEISRQIAEALRLRLTSAEQGQLARRETVNPDAYELLLRGRFHRSKGSTQDRMKATEYITKAIAVDPAYAAAYAELADHYRNLVNSSILDPKVYLPLAEQAAQKALALDEGLAEAHYALANLKTHLWQWDAADRGYRRAIELNPNLALARRWYASYLRLMGRHEEAIAEIARARALDPLSPVVNATVGYILFSARQYDRAIASLNKTLEIDRTYSYPYVLLGYTYAAQGRFSDAIASYQEAIKRGRSTPSTQIFLGAAYARAGDRERARAILKELQTGGEYVSPGELAVLHAALDDKGQAFASLERAYDAHDPQLQYIGVSPAFDSLRSDPRFTDLVRRVGLSR